MLRFCKVTFSIFGRAGGANPILFRLYSQKIEDVDDKTIKITVSTDDVEKLSKEELIRIANAVRK